MPDLFTMIKTLDLPCLLINILIYILINILIYGAIYKRCPQLKAEG